MIATTLRTLADAIGATLYGDDAPLAAVTTDTRKLTPGCLFIALQGESFDGHDFAARACEAGAAALLVSRRLPLAVPQLLVADTRLALGQLGAWVRSQVPARVVALTGSSGKTSVKEMSAAILAQCGNVLYTAGNLNNDIGVPLTLLRLEPQHDFAVIELGANHVGEIAYSVALTRPHSALVNNLAAAHLEGFGSLAGVARAKGEIFSDCPRRERRSSMPTATIGTTGNRPCPRSVYGGSRRRRGAVSTSMPARCVARWMERILFCIPPPARSPLRYRCRGDITSPMRWRRRH